MDEVVLIERLCARVHVPFHSIDRSIQGYDSTVITIVKPGGDASGEQDGASKSSAVVVEDQVTIEVSKFMRVVSVCMCCVYPIGALSLVCALHQ